MTQAEFEHQFQIGDAVLADFSGAQIPGVIEDERDGKLLVRLSDPWVDETGQKTDEAWLTPDKLASWLDQETGGSEALPG